MEYALELLIAYKYIVIIPLAVVEGPVLSMMCGFLLKLGQMSLVPAYLALMAGDLLGDTIWYLTGFYGGKRFVHALGKYFGVTEESYLLVERMYHKYHIYILTISKVTMGLGFPFVILTTAGVVKIPFRKFIAYNFLGQIVWTGALIAAGYFLGNFYLKVNKGLEIVSFISVAVVAFVFFIFISKFIRNKIKEKYL